MIELGRNDYAVFANRILWSLFAITTIIVVLRVICRLRYARLQRTGLGLDDYITIFCLILSLVVTVLITIATGYGLGRHSYELEDGQRRIALEYNVIINAILIWQFSLPKFAIIAILKRILNYGTRTAVLFWTLGITSQACIFAVSVWWFKQCDPIEFGWDKSIKGGTCADVRIMINLAYFTSAYSAFLDIFFAFYPIPFIMRLNMPLRSRIGVASALSLSSLAFVASVIKLSALGEAFAISAEDPTLPVPHLDILGMSEGYILMICSSLPTLGPLLRAAKIKLTSQDLATNKSGVHIESSLHSLQQSFPHPKGQRHTNDIERSISGGESSIDAIPLVSSPMPAAACSIKDFGIQKTVEVHMTSERIDPGSKPRQHSARIF
ncbi:uncharacterized protein F4807DRAFT_458979 [Annulohypoxylon truncatum]|uniref:uncharacterized protein n=1 Tax=Annulohypoxylon truncatum TaxID=327061 RepID=UPI002008577C|nr:uncharacterized protein F4807DRAFT_458979 [Annulohypoxylon truncatum]KAI1211405.1 hypothetical protein F4807DRAFT_458979 [Annulohypoxylon truncatum]